jgi:hypothetical protein
VPPVIYVDAGRCCAVANSSNLSSDLMNCPLHKAERAIAIGDDRGQSS